MPVVTLSDCASLAAPKGHYSHATRAGDLLFISGQLPDHPGKDVDFPDQVRSAMARLFAILEQAGGAPQDLARVTAYIVGVEHWPQFDAVYGAIMGEARPARAVVPVSELHYGALVEVEAVAYLPTSNDQPGLDA